MKQADLGLNLGTKRTRKREFLDEMDRVVPWAELVALITPHAPEGKRGRPSVAVETMLRIHFMQQWFTLSDPAMEEALHDTPLFKEFAGLDSWNTALPDETTILRFRHLLEKHKLAEHMLLVINELLGRIYGWPGASSWRWAHECVRDAPKRLRRSPNRAFGLNKRFHGREASMLLSVATVDVATDNMPTNCADFP